jgi:hypothetical protein
LTSGDDNKHAIVYRGGLVLAAVLHWLTDLGRHVLAARRPEAARTGPVPPSHHAPDRSTGDRSEGTAIGAPERVVSEDEVLVGTEGSTFGGLAGERHHALHDLERPCRVGHHDHVSAADPAGAYGHQIVAGPERRRHARALDGYPKRPVSHVHEGRDSNQAE